jgi:hypothetical protein
LSGIEKQVLAVTGLIEIIIPASVEILGEECFAMSASLSRVIFESGSRLSRIEKAAFRGTALVEIAIPVSVEVINMSCFDECRSLSSIIVESGSRLLGLKRFY